MTISTTQRWRRAMHPAFISGVLLSGVGIAFNVSHGWHLGGSDPLRSVGMAGVFLGCIALKDALLGQAVVAFKARRAGLALMCIVGLTIGAAGSFMAAFGSASEGREEKSDPRQAQITAYETARRTASDAETRLAELGRVPTAAEAKADVSRLLTGVDAGIAKRTAGCTVLPVDVGNRVQAVNRETCQPVIDALAMVAKADEANAVRAALADARATIARGAPKSADATVANLGALWAKVSGSTGSVDVGSVLALLVAAIVEIGAPVSWAIWMMTAPATVREFRMVEPDKKPDALARSFDQIKADALAEPSERSPLADLFSGEIPDGSNIVPFDPNGSGGGPKGGRRIRRTDRKADVQADIRARVSAGERFDSQEHLRAVLAERFGPISKSTLHDWLAELVDDVPRLQEGRRKVVG